MSTRFGGGICQDSTCSCITEFLLVLDTAFMLADYLKNSGESTLNLDDIPENETHRVLKGMQRRNHFQRQVDLLKNIVRD